jgi:hypothetical protein
MSWYSASMSIYATLWHIKVPRDGSWADSPDAWVELVAQGVPGHIGHVSHYPDGDPYGAFLPPALEGEWEGLLRAVVFVDDLSTKGTERSGQEYANPVLVLTGAEYETTRFPELLERLTDAIAERWMPRQTCAMCGREVLALPTDALGCLGDAGHSIIRPLA